MQCSPETLGGSKQNTLQDYSAWSESIEILSRLLKTPLDVPGGTDVHNT